MGKKSSKRAVRRAGLATSVNKNTTVVPPTIARPIVAPPTSTPVTRPTEVPPPVRNVQVVPPTATPPPVAQPATGHLQGVVVGIHYKKGGDKAIMARIQGPDGIIYTAHNTASTIPPTGSSVVFRPYEFNHTKAAEIIQVVGTDPLVTKRVDTIKRLSKYSLMNPQEFFGMSGTDVALPSVIGSTAEGMLIVHESDPS